MVITGSEIHFPGSGGKENVKQSWRDLEISTLGPETGNKNRKHVKVHVRFWAYGRFYFVGLHKTRHGKKLQRNGNESVKPFNKAYNGALWRKHHTTRHKESNYHSYGLPNVCNNGHQDKFKNVVTIFPFSPGILLYGMEFHQHSLVHNLGNKPPTETRMVPFKTTRQDLSI